MKRYLQMIEIVHDIQPYFIVEVGVHRAVRAAMLCEVMLIEGRPVKYVGYDVFESKPEKFQEEALNGKGMPMQAAAWERLRHAQRKYAVNQFMFDFIVGDTRETLHGKDISPDFAFIDGDHRVEAIRGDYRALRSAKCIVFDDYYMPDENGYTVDLEKYGANKIVKELQDEGKDVRVLDIGDRVKHGGISHLAVVRNGVS